MARYESWFKQDLKKPISVQMIQGNLFSADVQGNLIGVEVFDDGEAATLAGTVSANIIRPDGGTVAASGTFSGNKCSVVLPAAAYAYPGVATIAIKITDSGVVTTLLAAVVTIYRTSTDTIVDPGTIIPSIQSLITQIQTAVASIPADYSSLWTTLAPAYTSLTFPVKAGQHCTNGGVFYRAKQDIATSEEFTSSHWEAANIGNELSSLKSAISADEANEIVFANSGVLNFRIEWEAGSITDGTTPIDSDIRKRTKDFVSFYGSKKINVTVPSGKRLILWWYSTPSYNSLVDSKTWQTEDFQIDNTNNYYYKFVISDYPQGSTLVSESGFAFVADKSYPQLINENLNQFEAKLTAIGTNLFIPEEAEDSMAVQTDGSISGASNYWTTGYMDVDGYSYILLGGSVRVLRFAWYSSKSVSGFISYSAKSEMAEVPSGAKYLRVSYYKSYCPFADRSKKINVVPYGRNTAFETHEIFNNQYRRYHDEQLFYVDRGDYTETFTIGINKGEQGNKNMIVSFKGYYTGSSAPTIQFFMPSKYNENYYSSQVYTMGNNVYSDELEWRVPAFPIQAKEFKAVVTIPSGTTLHIDYLYNAYDNAFNKTGNGYRLNAHLGTPCIYPGNTMIGFCNAAKLGYSCLVTVPKRASDGVWVCFHDDENVGNTLCYPDGTSLSSSDASKSISDFTYSQLMAFSAGAKTSLFYADEKVPKLESFFELCQRTGISPMLSVHPNPTASEWAEIKALAKKYNVLQNLNIKGASITNCLEIAYPVFGDEIESYALDVSTNVDKASDLAALGWTLNHARLGVEYYNAVIDSAKVQNALTAGLFVACYYSHGTSARYKELLEMGVTEITDDNNCSYGLKW
jgi:glycerophosphoryl diester phosphodiesterase